MAAEDWPEEGWSVEGTGALEVGRGLVAVEISEELGRIKTDEVGYLSISKDTRG
jgi:hypothetical protein